MSSLETLAETFPNHVDEGVRPTGTFFQPLLHILDHIEENSAVVKNLTIEAGHTDIASYSVLCTYTQNETAVHPVITAQPLESLDILLRSQKGTFESLSTFLTCSISTLGAVLPSPVRCCLAFSLQRAEKEQEHPSNPNMTEDLQTITKKNEN